MFVDANDNQLISLQESAMVVANDILK